MSEVNYVIAAYMGARMFEDSRQVRDRLFFIREHLKHLNACSHGCAQITIVVAGPMDAQGYLSSLKELGGTPIRVLQRPNSGYSYGSWNHAFESCGDAFSHYVFVEDDYVPSAHLQVDRLVSLADQKGTYVCALRGRKGTHAAISNAVVSSDILNTVMPAPVNDNGFVSQTVWSQHFSESGYSVDDWTGEFSSPYWTGTEVRWYGHPSRPPAFIPIQAIGSLVGVVDGRDRIRAVLDGSGNVSLHTQQRIKQCGTRCYPWTLETDGGSFRQRSDMDMMPSDQCGSTKHSRSTKPNLA